RGCLSGRAICLPDIVALYDEPLACKDDQRRSLGVLIYSPSPFQPSLLDPPIYLPCYAFAHTRSPFLRPPRHTVQLAQQNNKIFVVMDRASLGEAATVSLADRGPSKIRRATKNSDRDLRPSNAPLNTCWIRAMAMHVIVLDGPLLLSSRRSRKRQSARWPIRFGQCCDARLPFAHSLAFTSACRRAVPLGWLEI
ncbi:hypothetical protein BC835DRAFT_1360992, partial [Cytidiella melzeri]